MTTTKLLASLLSCAMPFLPPPPLVAETLWDKAMLASGTERPLPRLVTLEEHFVNAQGKVEHASKISAELCRNSLDQIVFIPKNGTVNGAPIPEKDLAGMIEVLTEKELRGGLFNKDSKPAGHPETTLRTVAEHPCQPFPFTATIENRQARGTACLAIDSGQPLEVEWGVAEVPFTDDDATITAHRQVDRYRLGEGGHSRLERSEVTIALDYSLLLFSFTGELRRVTSFADYRPRHQLPPAPPAKTPGT